MRVGLPRVSVAILALLGASVPAFAHHGFTVEFDPTKCTDMKGTLTGITWENPHAYLQMDVKGADGVTHNWNVEMVTPNALKRNGTTRQDFVGNMGKPISARICPTKEGGTPYRGSAGYIMLADHLIRPVGQIKGGPPPDPKDF
jgi:Family of unknown function (DUF6152)